MLYWITSLAALAGAVAGYGAWTWRKEAARGG
jgi:hypothetical protein